MANTYTWDITQLDAKINEDNHENVVYMIHFIYNASDKIDPTINAQYIGTAGVNYNPENPFINFEDLTKDEVILWILDTVNIDFLNEYVDSKIELIKNPVDRYLQPNWN